MYKFGNVLWEGKHENMIFMLPWSEQIRKKNLMFAWKIYLITDNMEMFLLNLSTFWDIYNKKKSMPYFTKMNEEILATCWSMKRCSRDMTRVFITAVHTFLYRMCFTSSSSLRSLRGNQNYVLSKLNEINAIWPSFYFVGWRVNFFSSSL